MNRCPNFHFSLRHSENVEKEKEKRKFSCFCWEVHKCTKSVMTEPIMIMKEKRQRMRDSFREDVASAKELREQEIGANELAQQMEKI